MEDFVLPFSLFDVSQKGRIVCLKDEALKIIDQHQYPQIVNHYLLEILGLICVLGSDSKTKSIVTLQVSADKDSPISLLVADLEHNGGIRAYARFNEEKLKDLASPPPLQDIFLNGRMLFTVDFENDTSRYQAVVELKGETLTDCMAHYSKQSDQIPTDIKVFVQDSKSHLNGSRLVLAIMLQQMPIDQSALNDERDQKIEEWITILHFLKTLKAHEALNEDVSANTLLQRLFHEASLNIYNEKPLFFKCRCSREKVEQVIQSFKEEELNDLKEDGKIL
ncbi:MAG: Hsp33 family molecular chaperone HslO, partial [Proteobacteria bacterium]|nr:Hsp33 family molecular chaperone HslO [Pseudomonadota bacterium]